MALPLMSLKGLHAWFISDGYLWDWISAGLVIVISLTVPGGSLKPVNRFYTPGDPTLSYPIGNGTISSPVLYVLVFAVPFFIYVAYAFFRRSFHDG